MGSEVQTTWWSTWPKGLRWGLRAVGIGYALLIAIALVVVLVRDSHPVTPVRSVEAPPTAHLAHYGRGVVVRVSSLNALTRHHPMFLIDGLSPKRGVEKWVSGPSDPTPWVELIFPAPQDVSRIDLVHAGHHENPIFTARDYVIRCFSVQGELAELSVRDNELPIAKHPIDCPAAERIRIDFEDTVRLYEIKAWGDFP